MSVENAPVVKRAVSGTALVNGCGAPWEAALDVWVAGLLCTSCLIRITPVKVIAAENYVCRTIGASKKTTL